jgi:hypothetical protein
MVALQREKNGIEKFFKLSTSVSIANMHLFDSNCVLKKYATITDAWPKGNYRINTVVFMNLHKYNGETLQYELVSPQLYDKTCGTLLAINDNTQISNLKSQISNLKISNL